MFASCFFEYTHHSFPKNRNDAQMFFILKLKLEISLWETENHTQQQIVFLSPNARFPVLFRVSKGRCMSGSPSWSWSTTSTAA